MFFFGLPILLIPILQPKPPALKLHTISQYGRRRQRSCKHGRQRARVLRQQDAVPDLSRLNQQHAEVPVRAQPHSGHVRAGEGTLGVTTLLDIQLIDAKSFVELTYHPVSSISEAWQKI